MLQSLIKDIAQFFQQFAEAQQLQPIAIRSEKRERRCPLRK
jgi:hypothetical protein